MQFVKFFRYLLVGAVFGIVLAKSEVISWYRIYEMFRFHSFHMYGIIGSAVLIGIGLVQLIKRSQLKSIDGREIQITPKKLSWARYLIGGAIFGLGWAMTGACPGPMLVQIGHGVEAFGVMILAAIAGTYVYGLLRSYLPH